MVYNTKHSTNGQAVFVFLGRCNIFIYLRGFLHHSISFFLNITILFARMTMQENTSLCTSLFEFQFIDDLCLIYILIFLNILLNNFTVF